LASHPTLFPSCETPAGLVPVSGRIRHPGPHLGPGELIPAATQVISRKWWLVTRGSPFPAWRARDGFYFGEVVYSADVVVLDFGDGIRPRGIRECRKGRESPGWTRGYASKAWRAEAFGQDEGGGVVLGIPLGIRRIVFREG